MNMGDLSTHFSQSEFVCEHCGCSYPMSNLLINRLEQMFTIMDAKAIYVNSGYRCENNPWGSKTDAHRKGIAADIRVQKKDGSWYTSWDIAEVAEKIGFGGIGLMLPNSCHVDTRDTDSYTNNHWFGNEYAYGNTPKNDWIKTFQRGTVFAGEQSNPIQANSTKADIEGLQKILNNGGANLEVDGICGRKTLSAVKKYTVELNDKGNLVKWVQDRLNQLGYNAGYADGFSEQPTMDAVHKWQDANGLGIGYLGGSDWDILLK